MAVVLRNARSVPCSRLADALGRRSAPSVIAAGESAQRRWPIQFSRARSNLAARPLTPHPCDGTGCETLHCAHRACSPRTARDCSAAFFRGTARCASGVGGGGVSPAEGGGGGGGGGGACDPTTAREGLARWADQVSDTASYEIAANTQATM
jgi:hypothetical protein